jgi:hypothetical protein
MARGWESKSIESQQEEASRERAWKPPLNEQQRAVAARKRTLELTRASAASDLARARSAPHKEMLERAIKAIDDQLAQLQSSG